MARIVGATNEQTRNTVTLGVQQKASVRCGADILLSGLYQDVEGEAVCPVCGSKTRVLVKTGQVTSVSPESALLHYVVDDPSRFSICCNDTFIFDRERCLEVWLESRNGNLGKVSSLPEFMNEVTLRRGPSTR